LARLFRALSGESQNEFGERVGVHPNLIADHEMGWVEPSRETLDRMAQGVGLTVPAGEEILRYAESLRQPRPRSGEGLGGLTNRLAAIGAGVYHRLLRLPLPEIPPEPEAMRQLAGRQWTLLKGLPGDQQLAVVRLAREFQHWALMERVCEESVAQASRDLVRATHLAHLGREIADRLPGPRELRDRSRGFAEAHVANVLRVPGKLKEARAVFEEAKRLWSSGSDPGQLLDPGRLHDLEASLFRAEREFDQALSCLDEAMAVGRSPGRVLINKGFTLEVMGEYERAVEALLEAGPLVERLGDPRLLYMQRFNLAVNYTHLCRYEEATQLMDDVGKSAAERGDVIELSRITWLEGRIAAGLGRTAKARRLLEQARTEFAARGMDYDVALALLEETILLLADGRTAEVKELALVLKTIFVSKGVHREALAALQLFQEAAEREAATVELGRSVLCYLFRARYDEGLRFEAA